MSASRYCARNTAEAKDTSSVSHHCGAGYVGLEVRKAPEPSEKNGVNFKEAVCAPMPDPIRTMAIHMGIMCNVCRTVHFIATSPNINASKLTPGMYRLKCNTPCFIPVEFRRESMQSYRVSQDVFKRGYAREGEYESVG